MNLVIATNNNHKLEEINEIVGQKIKLLRLIDINCTDEIPETGSTLEANAFQKANFIFKKYNYNCFADDTGLEVHALNGEPGVFSARYGGEERSSAKNIAKLLGKMVGIKNRSAQFRCVISLIIDGNNYSFEGVVKGRISETILGENGFGYDPIFIPDGFSESFAQMDSHDKNTISHRGIAVSKLVTFLNDSQF